MYKYFVKQFLFSVCCWAYHNESLNENVVKGSFISNFYEQKYKDLKNIL